MIEKTEIHLSGFADEAANQKLAVQQFCAFAAVGLKYFSLRFIDVGNGIKNVMLLDKSEVKQLNELRHEYGLSISSIGSPIGKVKIADIEDGTKNRFVPFKQYMKEVQQACALANAFDCKLIRGFSFYHPKGSEVAKYVPQAIDQAKSPHSVIKKGLLLDWKLKPISSGTPANCLQSFTKESRAKRWS